MKINEVEQLSGIPKKNIRFYEEQGLLNPRRNSENGYREYGEEEVAVLRRIRLLRKLGIPIEEIRLMLTGRHTVGDGMRRHLVTLERERRNLEQSILLVEELQSREISVDALEADEILARMEQLEQGGTRFPDNTAEDIRKQFVAPVIVTAVVVALMAAICGLLLWAYYAAPEEAPPIWFLLVIIGVLAAVGVGCVLALTQRMGEIRKGEIEDAKRY